MKGKINVRNGFFSKECEFAYNSGYITHVNSTHEQTASYNKSKRNIDINDHYTTSVKMNDFETRKEKKIHFPFKLDFNQGDMSTIFYVNDDKDGYQVPVGLYNHEHKEGYVNPNIRVFLGFRLLNVGKVKRGFAWLVNVFEHILSFGIAFLSTLLLSNNGILSFFVALLSTKLVWYPVAFISNLFLPSYYGANRAYAKFEKEVVKIGLEEVQKSRHIKEKLTEINDPLSKLRAAGIDFESNNQNISQTHTQTQTPPPENNGGFKPMF